MDIKYIRNGIEKMAGERFKEALTKEGWAVVENPVEKPKRKKEASGDDNS